ncbi:MAG: phosphoenolpyruvate kinase, partial [Gammaproteobacteria bacterium]|nr:phosphoenolpyruvate kinase [Gammaproteobacteria bacterium]
MKQRLTDKHLEGLYQRLTDTNNAFTQRYPGLMLQRQPIHTVYGGAHLYKPGVVKRLGGMAVAHLNQFAPRFVELARALEFPGASELPTQVNQIDALETQIQKNPAAAAVTCPNAWLAWKIHAGVRHKLATQAIEDQRVDFEDGYGARPDSEEDDHAIAAAEAMSAGIKAGDLPQTTGIRIKSLTEETKHRSLRTLDLFVSCLCDLSGSVLPDNFVITLPKVTTTEQVAVLADALTELEIQNGLEKGRIRIELMIETVQSLFSEDGSTLIPKLVKAGQGRVSAAILGTYDYTASANIASTWQDHKHASADFARQMMQAALVGSPVSISDGITNIMPIAPHRGGDEPLSQTQVLENTSAVHAAWKVHFDNIMH